MQKELCEKTEKHFGKGIEVDFIAAIEKNVCIRRPSLPIPLKKGLALMWCCLVHSGTPFSSPEGAVGENSLPCQ